MKNSLPDNRIWYLDAMKALGILLVTYGHLKVYHPPLILWGNTFKISVFWIVMGLLLSRQPSGTGGIHMRNRTVQMAIPYGFSSLLYLFCLTFIDSCTSRSIAYGSALSYLLQTVLLKGLGTLWFLPASLLGELLAVFILNRRGLLRSFFWCAAGAAAFFLLYPFVYEYQDLAYTYPLQCLEKALLCTVFILLGWLLGHTLRILETGSRSLKAFLFFIIVPAEIGLAVLSQRCTGVDINKLRFGAPPALWFFCSFFIPAGLITAFSLVCSDTGTVFLEPLLYWGRNSLLLMITQNYVLIPYTMWLRPLFLPYSHLNSLLSLTCFLAIEYLVIQIIRRVDLLSFLFTGRHRPAEP